MRQQEGQGKDVPRQRRSTRRSAGGDWHQRREVRMWACYVLLALVALAIVTRPLLAGRMPWAGDRIVRLFSWVLRSRIALALVVAPAVLGAVAWFYPYLLLGLLLIGHARTGDDGAASSNFWDALKIRWWPTRASKV